MVDEAGVLMAEAVMVLAPDVRGQQVVQGRNGPPPGNVPRDFQPFGVLVEHRIDNVDERLVTGEKSVAAGEQVTFEPALALMFAQHLHDPSIGRDVIVVGDDFSGGATVGDLEHRVPAVRRCLVRAEHAEVSGVELQNVPDELALHPRRFGVNQARLRHLDGVFAKVGHAQVA